MQRFFAVVETADSPFIPKQGPGNFGDIESCSGCVIKNGQLGLSSHHGVHGNRNSKLLLRDLDIGPYEVACISLNGAKQAAVYKVNCLGQVTNVPVRGTFS